MKQILFLTSTNLASNPRLVKELKLALANGYNATVIQFYIGNWSDAMTDELKLQFTGVKFIELSALRKPFLPWFISTAAQKICSLLTVGMMNTQMLSVVAGKRSVLLLQQLKTMSENYEWVVAHNPATFYPALVASRKCKARLGIDVEDYHPGETNDPKAAGIMKKLMQLLLPTADYCSYASPLIMNEVRKDIKGLKNNQLVLLNGFNGDEFIKPLPIEKEAIQLVWFSQNIDVNRGLENIIPVVNELYPLVELHLIGNLNPSFEAAFLQNKTGIIIHPSKPQKELHRFLSTFDVGLALEPGKDLNNQLAISNKIIACTQAGLFIVATHTAAQDEFLSKGKGNYEQVEDDVISIKKTLLELCSKKTELRKMKNERFESGRQYDWQHIAEPLLKVWG